LKIAIALQPFFETAKILDVIIDTLKEKCTHGTTSRLYGYPVSTGT